MLVLVFIVLSCVGRGLATGRPPVQAVLPTVEKTVSKPHLHETAQVLRELYSHGGGNKREKEKLCFVMNNSVLKGNYPTRIAQSEKRLVTVWMTWGRIFLLVSNHHADSGTYTSSSKMGSSLGG
jgi:hypothetical protein